MAKLRLVADDSNWREKIKKQRNLKLTDALKQVYLQQLAKHGKKGIAAAWAGVTNSTIMQHRSVDPDFDEAVEQSLSEFREYRARKIEAQALNGFDEVVFGPNGERGIRTRYETQLRAMVLKASDPELYSERTEIDLTFKGGAMIVPAILAPADWEAQFDAQRESTYLESPEERLLEETLGEDRTKHTIGRPKTTIR